MRLVSCHIDGFGKFNNADFDFEQGCNTFCKENGWGKTTLSIFIKVMLYGFDNEKKRDITLNERDHYKPWSGDVYGGRLVIEVSGDRYTIIRNFGKKSSEDQLIVHDETANKDTNIFGNNIGEALFQISSQSFARTAFISEGQCVTDVDSSISAKLGNLSGVQDDLAGYNKAMDILDKGMQLYKSRGKKGSINQADARLNEISSLIREKELLSDKSIELQNIINENNNRINEFRQNLSEISERMSKEAADKNKKVLKDKYEELIKNLSDRETKVIDNKRLFPNGVPDQETLDGYMNISSEMERLSGKESQAVLSEEDQENLKSLERYFEINPGLVSVNESKIQDWKDEIKNISDLQRVINEKDMPSYQRDKLNELSFKYENICSGQEEELLVEIDELQNDISVQTDLLQELKQEEFILSEKKTVFEEKVKKRNKRVTVSRIIALLMFIILVISIGYGCFYGANKYLIISAVIEGICMLYILFASFRKPETDSSIEEVIQRISELQEASDDINGKTQNFCERYNCDNKNLTFSLMKMRDELTEFIQLKAVSDSSPVKNLVAQVQDMTEHLSEELSKYEHNNIDNVDNYHNLYGIVGNIENKYIRFKQLKQRYNEVNEIKRYKKEKGSKLMSFLISNGFSESDEPFIALQTMSKRLTSLEGAMNELRKSISEKEQFEMEHPDYEEFYNLNVNNNMEETDIQELDAKRLDIESNVDILKRSNENYQIQLNQVLDKLDEIEVLENEYEELFEKRENDKDHYSILGKTKDFLEKSKQSFVNKYTGPVKQGFDKYYKELNDGDPSLFYLDADMKLSVDMQGFRRKDELLSKGQQDLTGICMRMALVDAMFTGEKPFVIFDDPFANMDTDVVLKGKRLLNQMANDYQIIYFTCHESRAN